MNQAKTREFFTVHMKVSATDFKKVMVSNHKHLKQIRQDFMTPYHNKEPIVVSNIMPGTEILFFNAYSQIKPAEDVAFNINDSEATRLIDITDALLVLSVVGKLKFKGESVIQNYVSQNGKRRSDKMREVFISDGSKTMTLTVWSDLIDVLVEDQLIQMANLSSRVFNEEICLTSNFSSSICFLTESLDIQFEQERLEQENQHASTIKI